MHWKTADLYLLDVTSAADISSMLFVGDLPDTQHNQHCYFTTCNKQLYTGNKNCTTLNTDQPHISVSTWI